jgi:hypothetical protein
MVAAAMVRAAELDLPSGVIESAEMRKQGQTQ